MRNGSTAVRFPALELPIRILLINHATAQPQLRIVPELFQQQPEVGGLHGYIGIHVPNKLVFAALKLRNSGIDRVHLGGKISRMIFSNPTELDKAALNRIALDYLVGLVGGPVADNHPLHRSDLLRDHGTNRVLDETSLVVCGSDEDVRIAQFCFDRHYLLAIAIPVPLSHLMQDKLLPILKAASAR